MNTPEGSRGDDLPVSPQSVSFLLVKSRIDWQCAKDLQVLGKDLRDLTYSAVFLKKEKEKKLTQTLHKSNLRTMKKAISLVSENEVCP